MPINKIERKKDGKQGYRVRVNYIDANGKACQVERTVYGLPEARLVESELLVKTANKTASSRKTVNDIFSEYVMYKKNDVRASTLDKSSRIIKNHVLPYYKDTDIKKLSKKSLAEWKATIADKGLSITTQKNIYTAFSALINYAVTMDYIPRNPLSALGNFKDIYFTDKTQKIQYYTPEEFKQYIAIAKTDAENSNTVTAWGYYVFFNIAYMCGLRKGEINALKWSDIDGDVFHIRRSIAQKLKGLSFVETPVKNKSSIRDIQIPAPLMSILSEHKTRQKAAGNFSEENRICGGINILSDTSIANKNIAFAKASGLHQIRIHDFRHSHASLLANNGINIQEIARRLGHSNIEITWNTYSHLYPRETERAVKLINDIF